MEFNYLTHPKHLRQDFGLPNFVTGDIINKNEVITILTAFSILGLNTIYINPNKYCYNSGNFMCVKVDRFINYLKDAKTDYVKILVNKNKLSIEEITSHKVLEDNLGWHFKDFKICPTLTKLYFRNELD